MFLTKPWTLGYPLYLLKTGWRGLVKTMIIIPLNPFTKNLNTRLSVIFIENWMKGISQNNDYNPFKPIICKLRWSLLHPCTMPFYVDNQDVCFKFMTYVTTNNFTLLKTKHVVNKNCFQDCDEFQNDPPYSRMQFQSLTSGWINALPRKETCTSFHR